MATVARRGLTKAMRLRKRREFVEAQERGVRVTTRHFILLLARSPGAAKGATARLGVTASSKQVGNAVQRARAKRLVREAFRLSEGLFLPGLDVVVIAKAGVDELTLGEVSAEWASVRGLLRKRGEGLLSANRG